MACLKMLCIVFILTLFGEIRANIDSDASAAAKHVAVHQVLPPSILYLLRSRPIGHSQPSPVASPSLSVPQNPVSSNTYPAVPFTPPVAPTAPVLPTAPIPPMPPVAPTPPTLPSAPNSGASSVKHVPVHHMLPPSILYLLNHRPIRPQSSQPPKSVPSSPSTAPRLSYNALYPSSPSQPGLRVSQTSNPIRSAPLPGQLTYDNPSNDNRKLLNVVHVPLTRQAVPAPLPDYPSNSNRKVLNVVHVPLNSPAVPNSQPDPKSTEAKSDNTPLGPAPLSSEVSSTSQIEDLSPLPSDTVGASPISAKPVTENESSDTQNTNTLNVKDLPFQPVNNIDASPIPVKPRDEATSGTKNTDKSALTENESSDTQNTNTLNVKDLPFQPVNNIEASPIPVRPHDKATSGTKNTDKSALTENESSDTQNTNTFNVKDLPFQPVNNIEASPIPVRPRDEATSGTKNTDKSALTENESSDTQNTNTLNVKDLPFQPVNNIEASPIPVRPRDDATSGTKNTDKSALTENESSDTQNTNTLNVKDLPFQPVNNIEASPIPVRPHDKATSGTKNTDKSALTENESSDTQNTNTLNVKDLPFQPVNNIEASPIPVRPHDEATSGTKNIDVSEDSIKPEDLSPEPANTVESSPIPSKPSDIVTRENNSDDTSNSESQGLTTGNTPSTSKNANQDSASKDNSKDNTEPIQEASTGNVSDKNNASEESLNATADTFNTKSGTTQVKSNRKSPDKNEEPQNPLGNVILNGTSSNDNENTQTEKPDDNQLKDVTFNGDLSNLDKNTQNDESKDNPLKDVVVNGNSSNINENTPSSIPQDNPLKDVILNGTSSNANQNTDTEKSQDNPLKDVIVNGDPSNDTKNTQTENPQDNPLKDVIVNDASSDANKNTQTKKSQDNPLKDVIVNDASSNANKDTQTEKPQDNPQKEVIVNETKAQGDNNNSLEKSSNEAQTESSPEKHEETQSETSQGSSKDSTSHIEENTDISSNSPSNKESSANEVSKNTEAC